MAEEQSVDQKTQEHRTRLWRTHVARRDDLLEAMIAAMRDTGGKCMVDYHHRTTEVLIALEPGMTIEQYREKLSSFLNGNAELAAGFKIGEFLNFSVNDLGKRVNKDNDGEMAFASVKLDLSGKLKVDKLPQRDSNILQAIDRVTVLLSDTADAIRADAKRFVDVVPREVSGKEEEYLSSLRIEASEGVYQAVAYGQSAETNTKPRMIAARAEIQR